MTKRHPLTSILDRKFRLSPFAYMKKDTGRSILFKFSPSTLLMESRQYIHPAIATLISLFDGERTVKEIAKILSYIANIPEESALNEISRLLGGELTQGEKWLVEVEKAKVPLFKKKYNPLEFVDTPTVGVDMRMKSPYMLNYLSTFRCFAKCIYCYAEVHAIPPPPEMPLERVKELIDEAKELEVLQIYIGGGDPLCNPDFWEILSYVIKAGIIPFVSTKTLLNDKQIAMLKDSGLQVLQVSIDTLNSTTAKFMIGVAEFPSRMLSVISKLVKCGIKTLTNTVLTPLNVKEVPELVSVLSSLGVSHISFTPYGRSHYRHSDSLFLTLDHYKWLSQQIEMLRSKYPFITIKYNDMQESINPSPEKRKELWTKRALCSGGKEGLVIHPDGKVTLCEELPHSPQYFVGDVSRQSIKEVWESEELLEAIMPRREKFKG